MRKFIAENVPKLKQQPGITVELNAQHGAKPEIEVDGKQFKTDCRKQSAVVKDLGKKLGLNL